MKKALLYILITIAGAFIWWAFSPLFIDKNVQDELDPILKARLEAQRQVNERREAAADSNQTNNQATIESDKPVEFTSPTDSPEVITSGPFPILDTPSHPATGEVQIIYSPEERLVYYKNYQGTNGPDLRVYLAKDLEAKEYLDLGPAKGNSGDIIYGLPMDVNLEEYKYIITWCKAFGVLFDYAEIKS